MQLDITFRKDRLRLPICTSTVIQGLLYHALKEDERYSTHLHEIGNQCGKRTFKLFTFSELRGRYEVDSHHIVFLEEARLSVRSVDADCIRLLFDHFRTHPTVALGSEAVAVADVRLQDDPILAEEITVRTISPLTVYVTESDGHTVYFSPDDAAFYHAVVRNARRKWISYFGNDHAFSLTVEPAAGARFKKCATRFKTTFITAWHGTFVLKAPAKVLDFLYQTGLGSKNSQGFGMFDIIRPKTSNEKGGT